MLLSISLLAALASLASVADAECANACNGHGKCTSYDMCLCNRNWQGNDCSERVCQFGSAHVDSPKGDLDMSGGLSGPDAPVVDNNFVYPYGTTEQFPQMEDSDLKTLVNSAHYYMECSNKGTCNRATGDCMCYEGYDGVSCQRASCPGYPSSCSGHGVCKTIQQLAKADHGNVYKLWDKDVSMGCECDAGYWGPDCSLRACKTGVDPLYLDDAATVRYSTWDFAVLTDGTSYTDLANVAGTGHWAIRFFDSNGEDWLTGPIEAEASCEDVVAALEALPNNVIPASTISCTNTVPQDVVNDAMGVRGPDADPSNKHPQQIWYQMAMWEFLEYTDANLGELSEETARKKVFGSGDKRAWSEVDVYGNIYRLKFYGNPGKLRQPEIEVHLDGKRPSIGSPDGIVVTKVWTDGQAGEDVDNFADHCDGVTVTIVSETTLSASPVNWDDDDFGAGATNMDFSTKQSYLTGMTSAERNLLKACLGDSDFDTSNNVDVYNWDHGSQLYPHMVKLVPTVTTHNDGGYYAVLWFNPATTGQQGGIGHKVGGGGDPNLIGPFDISDSSGEGGVFMLMNPFRPADASRDTKQYDIYTTKGTLALTSNYSEAVFSFGSKYVYMTNSSYDRAHITDESLEGSSAFDGDISCEIGNNKYVFHCLNKTDQFTMIDWMLPYRNPKNLNLYTAERLYTLPYEHDVDAAIDPDPVNSARNIDELHFMTHIITTDIGTNWGAVAEDTDSADPLNDDAFDKFHGQDRFNVYKFFPAVASQYEYTAECSNRGICDTSSGLCKCFSGYTSDSCGEQISVSC